jgi:hypothetical protein
MLAVLLSGLATSTSKLGYRLGTEWASTHFAFYDAWVDDMMGTGPCWRLMVSTNLPVPWLEPALSDAWTRTCSARCLESKLLSSLLDSNLLTSLPGLKLVLSAAASFTDRRSFYLAVSSGPAFRFPIGVVRLLRCSSCFDVATLMYIPPPPTHTHLTSVLYLQVVNWQVMRSHLDRYWGIFPSGSNGCCNWGDKLYSSWEETTEFIVLTPRRYRQILSAWLPVWECRVRLGKYVIKLNITIIQSDPNTDVAYKDLQRFQLKIMFQGNVIYTDWN